LYLFVYLLQTNFHEQANGVCAVSLDSRLSFGNEIVSAEFGTGVILVSLVTMSNFAHAKRSS